MNRCFLRITALMCLLISIPSCELWKNGRYDVGNPRRLKRIIGGDKFDNRKEVPYKVIEYYVWIGDVHDCTEEPSWWERGLFGAGRNFIGEIIALFTKCPENKEYLLCGGALIAPKIVQTACHCLATWNVAKPRQNVTKANIWVSAKVESHFEKLKNIYMGEVDVAAFQYPIRSKKFVVHQKCSQLSLSPKNIRFDFGWIVLDLAVPWQEGVLFGTWGKLDYAGPYHKQEITDVYETAVGQRHVCLIVGFGLNEKGYFSQHMRQAWIQFIDSEQCRQALYTSYDLAKYYSYNESATWICAQRLPEVMNNTFRGRHASGDSGSPVTCSNNYVALVTGTLAYKATRVGFNEMLAETAIHFAPEANSVETRTDWENQLLMRAVSDELRVLRLPSGQMLKHPRLKYPELKKGSMSVPLEGTLNHYNSL